MTIRQLKQSARIFLLDSKRNVFWGYFFYLVVSSAVTWACSIGLTKVVSSISLFFFSVSYSAVENGIAALMAAFCEFALHFGIVCSLFQRQEVKPSSIFSWYVSGKRITPLLCAFGIGALPACVCEWFVMNFVNHPENLFALLVWMVILFLLNVWKYICLYTFACHIDQSVKSVTAWIYRHKGMLFSSFLKMMLSFWMWGVGYFILMLIASYLIIIVANIGTQTGIHLILSGAVMYGLGFIFWPYFDAAFYKMFLSWKQTEK